MDEKGREVGEKFTCAFLRLEKKEEEEKKERFHLRVPPRFQHLCGVVASRWPLGGRGHKLSTLSYLSDRSCFKQKSP